ncbi:serine-rich adhesin for platelets [Vanessa tameamea]|uniref:Serine-rich adhesin for platelets n=1 Tax=Vanessa tameamea TaxID=334116 RepID=A0ABM4AR10_VANTA
MESFEDSNCPSMSDSFSLYERYMRSFNVINNFDDNRHEISDPSSNCESSNSNSGGNIDLSTVIHSNIDKHRESSKPRCSSLHSVLDNAGKIIDLELVKVDSPFTSPAASLSETSSATNHCLNDKSEVISDVPVTSEESRSEGFKSVFITSTMENSNNAVDSVPMFRDVKSTESVFKLPISELSFNGTILKHVQKLKPIVDPITALSTARSVLNLSDEHCPESIGNNEILCNNSKKSDTASDSDDKNTFESINTNKLTSSSSSLQEEEENSKKEQLQIDGNSKWNLDQSYSSLDASYDSGMRSPDMFSDEDDIEPSPQQVPFWDFLKDYETYDKRKVRKIEETLKGILPPPSVTTLRTDVTQMLKKYYCFLPAFNEAQNLNVEANTMTPTKKVSFIKIPPGTSSIDDLQETAVGVAVEKCKERNDKSDFDANISANDKSIELKLCSESEALESAWPDVLKCKYYDVYYNITSYSEKIEQLMQRYGERFIGAETDTSVNIYSGGLQSPSSASKRKAMRLKMAQVKSPGRRLSHLARRRQAFCSAATINEKAQSSTSKMVLIDKNFFPHRKLINSAERKSPRTRRTPGKKTPAGKTPGKKTPAKTPKTKSGGSSRKKAMRRLLMDSDSLIKSQPSRETSKRALFISPENKKTIPATCSSVPHQAMKSKRALFGSPVRQAETKSLDGTSSDHFLKRKRDSLDDIPETNRSKIAKSLSFGGDTINPTHTLTFNRRASEMSATKSMAELNETHKKKLLWAVTEALRLHGWRMSSAGFREKASSLARLTRRLLALAPHAAKLAAPTLSTSDTMFKLARQYVFPIIQGRTVEECFQDEQIKLANESNKISGYISASAYQLIKSKQVTSTFTSQIKENTCNESSLKQEQPRSGTKNVLQDKLVNIDTNSNSSSGFSTLEKAGVYKSNSMPSFEEAAKMRARRQISFDNVDFPKR